MAKVRRSPQQWQQLIEAQQSSALSVNQFCAEHKITVSNFYLQRKKYQAQPISQVAPSNDWLSLSELMQTRYTARDWHIELKLPNGVVLTMRTDAEG